MANLRAHQRRVLSVVDPCSYSFRYGTEPLSQNFRHDKESQVSLIKKFDRFPGISFITFTLYLLHTVSGADIRVVLFDDRVTQPSCLGDDCRVYKVRSLVTQYTNIALT